MTIWLLLLPLGMITYALRASFLASVGQIWSAGWLHWLRFASPAVLAALVVSLLLGAEPLDSPEVIRQALALGVSSTRGLAVPPRAADRCRWPGNAVATPDALPLNSWRT